VLRISDDQLRLLRFNDEKSFIDFWHARMLPNAPARKSTVIYSVVKDIYPDHVYKTMESSVDGIVDVKIDEEGGEVRSLMRIRNMRSIGYHSHWHPLKVDENFRVALEK
jgi:KaiC/GvpD/RAD55 family RecA-like ATPase